MESLYSYYTQVLFLSLIVINHLFEIYLSRRQVNTLQNHITEVPSEFCQFLSLQDHQKAVNYAVAKLRTGQVRFIWDLAFLYYWFPLRGAERLYLALPGTGLNRELFFLLSIMLIQSMASLPWSIYSTFVLEQKFGFNRSTPKLFILDLIKGAALGLLLGVPFLYGILFIYDSAGKWWWLVSFLFVTVFQFFLIWLYPSFIAPLFNKFKPLESDELKNGIDKLVTNAGFNTKGVFVIDASKRSSHGNAYFTGLGKNKRVVFYDTLLKDLTNKEVFAILAHELGHMKLKHIPKSLILSLILSFVGFSLMGLLSTSNWFYSGHFMRMISPGAILLIFSQAVPTYTFWFGPINAWISRKREYEADAYAAKETSPDDLISGLIKLYEKNASPVVTDTLYSKFYHSHPHALERIKKLESFK